MNTEHELRESAMSGVGPMWRGQSLLPAIDHISILERSQNAALLGVEPDTFDILALIFITQADWSQVFAAAHSIGDGGEISFDAVTWHVTVFAWVRSLEKPILSEEVVEIRETFGLIARQIKASQWRRIKDGQTLESSERDVGNWRAPLSPRGMRRGFAGLLLAVAAIMFAAGYLTRLACN